MTNVSGLGGHSVDHARPGTPVRPTPPAETPDRPAPGRYGPGAASASIRDRDGSGPSGLTEVVWEEAKGDGPRSMPACLLALIFGGGGPQGALQYANFGEQYGWNVAGFGGLPARYRVITHAPQGPGTSAPPEPPRAEAPPPTQDIGRLTSDRLRERTPVLRMSVIGERHVDRASQLRYDGQLGVDVGATLDGTSRNLSIALGRIGRHSTARVQIRIDTAFHVGLTNRHAGGNAAGMMMGVRPHGTINVSAWTHVARHGGLRGTDGTVGADGRLQAGAHFFLNAGHYTEAQLIEQYNAILRDNPELLSQIDGIIPQLGLSAAEMRQLGRPKAGGPAPGAIQGTPPRSREQVLRIMGFVHISANIQRRESDHVPRGHGSTAAQGPGGAFTHLDFEPADAHRLDANLTEEQFTGVFRDREEGLQSGVNDNYEGLYNLSSTSPQDLTADLSSGSQTLQVGSGTVDLGAPRPATGTDPAPAQLAEAAGTPQGAQRLVEARDTVDGSLDAIEGAIAHLDLSQAFPNPADAEAFRARYLAAVRSRNSRELAAMMDEYRQNPRLESMRGLTTQIMKRMVAYERLSEAIGLVPTRSREAATRRLETDTAALGTLQTQSQSATSEAQKEPLRAPMRTVLDGMKFTRGQLLAAARAERDVWLHSSPPPASGATFQPSAALRAATEAYEAQRSRAVTVAGTLGVDVPDELEAPLDLSGAPRAEDVVPEHLSAPADSAAISGASGPAAPVAVPFVMMRPKTDASLQFASPASASDLTTVTLARPTGTSVSLVLGSGVSVAAERAARYTDDNGQSHQGRLYTLSTGARVFVPSGVQVTTRPPTAS